MYKLAILFILLISFNANATKCSSWFVKEDDRVKIESLNSPYLSADEYELAVPTIVEDKYIYKIYLLQEDNDGVVDDIFLAPISFQVESEMAISTFFVNVKKGNFYIHSWYGGSCGPRLRTKVQ